MRSDNLAKIFTYILITFDCFFIRTDLNLEELSVAATDVLMNHPIDLVKFCECIGSISKLVCLQIHIELIKENIDLTESDLNALGETEFEESLPTYPT